VTGAGILGPVLDIRRIDALRTDEELHALVIAVIGADEHDEGEAIEWKRDLDWGSARDAFAVGRAVLGMANRHPGRASSEFEGFGYLVVGADHDGVHGTSPGDPADYVRQVNKYVGGASGPRWQPRPLNVNGDTVVVVVVDPPRNGDPIWPLRYAYMHDHVGRVFVRHFGRTEVADDNDIDMLTRRAAATRSVRPDVAVEVAGDVPLRWLDRTSAAEEMIATIDAKFAELMNTAREVERAKYRGDSRTPPRPAVPGSAGVTSAADWKRSSADMPVGDAAIQAMFGNIGKFADLDKLAHGLIERATIPDPRSLDEYEAEIEEWADLSRAWAKDSLRVEAAHSGVGRIRFRITNRSEVFLRDVEIRVRFDPTVVLVTDDVPLNELLPEMPTPFGEPCPAMPTIPIGAYTIPALDTWQSSSPKGPVAWADAMVEGGFRLDIGDLRPDATVETDDVWIFVNAAPSEGKLVGDWHLSASTFDGIVTGQTTLAVTATSIDWVDAFAHDDDESDEHADDEDAD
jgi:hypothetical protein